MSGQNRGRGRGRGGRGRGTVNHMVVDHRPKALTIGGFVEDEKDELLQHFAVSQQPVIKSLILPGFYSVLGNKLKSCWIAPKPNFFSLGSLQDTFQAVTFNRTIHNLEQEFDPE